MRLLQLAEQWFLAAADHLAARRRCRPPSARQLAVARIVAHRGAYDNRRIMENTMAAFAAFEGVGGWGIELDVRWTRDGVPVVAHDPDGGRLFGVPRRIAAMDRSALRQQLPLVPTLSAVVKRFGGRLHLMVEIKCLWQDDPDRTRERLQHHLEDLQPVRDYHLLSLDTDRLARLAFTPSRASLPIARINPRPAARAARFRSWGGLTGHYALIRRGHIENLQRRGLRVGTGFVNSANCLYHELSRGVDWLFSDRPLAMQRIVAFAQEGSSTR